MGGPIKSHMALAYQSLPRKIEDGPAPALHSSLKKAKQAERRQVALRRGQHPFLRERLFLIMGVGLILAAVGALALLVGTPGCGEEGPTCQFGYGSGVSLATQVGSGLVTVGAIMFVGSAVLWPFAS